MKKTLILMGLVALLSIGCNSDKKRYELVACPFSVNNTTYIGMRMVDTYTGDIWSEVGMHHKDADSNWVYSGNPTKLNQK